MHNSVTEEGEEFLKFVQSHLWKTINPPTQGQFTKQFLLQSYQIFAMKNALITFLKSKCKSHISIKIKAFKINIIVHPFAF